MSSRKLNLFRSLSNCNLNFHSFCFSTAQNWWSCFFKHISMDMIAVVQEFSAPNKSYVTTYANYAPKKFTSKTLSNIPYWEEYLRKWCLGITCQSIGNLYFLFQLCKSSSFLSCFPSFFFPVLQNYCHLTRKIILFVCPMHAAEPRQRNGNDVILLPTTVTFQVATTHQKFRKADQNIVSFHSIDCQ